MCLCVRLLEGTDGEDQNDSYQGPDFEPIVPLPDEVEVKTGEEGEKVRERERYRGARSTKILTSKRMRSCNTVTQALRICSAVLFVRFFVERPPD